MDSLVLSDRIGSVATLTLNRPERHNSLVPALLREMIVALEAIRRDSSVRVMILQANGRSFSTGGDLRGFYEHMETIETYASTIVGLLNQTILTLIGLPVPIVAAVHGIVTGGSLGLVLGSDVVLVTPEASFTPYYSVVGFSPDGGWTALLPALIGHRRAAAVLLQNQSITAEQAVDWGLANRLVPTAEIHAEALTIAEKIASLKTGSLRQTKRLFSMAHGDLAARLESERSSFVRHIITSEARQGIAAFLEGRGPAAGSQGSMKARRGE
jgi:2-(1,2-epoxy-1,2-dihydrophenyl)acetyl-CoA isomerase